MSKRKAAIVAAGIEALRALEEERAELATVPVNPPPLLPRCTFCEERAPVAFKVIVTDGDGAVLDMSSGCLACRKRLRPMLSSRFGLELGEVGQQALPLDGAWRVGPAVRG
jgi:hypothetical protein